MDYKKLALISVISSVIIVVISFIWSYVFAILFKIDMVPFFIFLIGVGILIMSFYYYKIGTIIDFYGIGICKKPKRSFYLKFWYLIFFGFIVLLIGLRGLFF